jgi:hypothetical protein
MTDRVLRIEAKAHNLHFAGEKTSVRRHAIASLSDLFPFRDTCVAMLQITLDVMLSASEASAFPPTHEKQILRRTAPQNDITDATSRRRKIEMG